MNGQDMDPPARSPGSLLGEHLEHWVSLKLAGKTQDPMGGPNGFPRWWMKAPFGDAAVVLNTPSKRKICPFLTVKTVGTNGIPLIYSSWARVGV